LAILYGNGKDFGQKIKNKMFSKIYEVFDVNEAYVNVVEEKLLLSSKNLIKSKQIKANLKSRKFYPNLYGKKYKTCQKLQPLPFLYKINNL
jgi:hypothetical protein